jgi:hypothetical protein
VIRVRTNVRGEDDYLYRIRMPLPAMRSLFLGYVEQAHRLVNEPRFYNTITVNCTTLVYHMMKRIVGYLPWSYRLLFTGYLPAYVYRVGGLDQRYARTRTNHRPRETVGPQRHILRRYSPRRPDDRPFAIAAQCALVVSQNRASAV